MLTVLNLGWGVQSWTLAAMVALDELPRPDLVIHSDTRWEREGTYRFAAEQTRWLAGRGVEVITVTAENSQAVTTHKTDIPAFTVSPKGNDGQLRRQCTSRWKIQPIRRRVSQELYRRGIPKRPGAVEQWLGITTDEIHRAKDADVRYITHVYPLLAAGMSRQDCLTWLESRGLPVPQKSSCTFCPFHDRAAWQEMKREGGNDWQQAVQIDIALREARPPYSLFVHSSRIPLEEAVDIPEDYGYTQPNLLDLECDSGFCFL
jgi:hypothetical protein